VNKISLSICIPVYNFGAFIGETLQSIVPQATDEVEIVVVDGASTDNTAEVIAPFQSSFPGLRYHRLEKRGGIDRDMARSVELASGEYCWLFGGDDIMHEGAVAKVLRDLPRGHDLILCESLLCDIAMRPISRHDMLRCNEDRVFDLGDRQDRQVYFAAANNTAAFFSFCSSLVIRKSRWQSLPMDERFIGSSWAHVARIFGMLPGGLTIKYLHEPLLSKRGDNDSFLEKGLVNRYRIAIEGFNRIADAYFGHDSFEAFHIRRSLHGERNLKSMLDAKLLCSEKGLREDRELLDRLAAMLYSDPLLLNRIKLLLYRYSPVPLLRVAKPVYASLRRILPVLL
jgi:abequosyltransferase